MSTYWTCVVINAVIVTVVNVQAVYTYANFYKRNLALAVFSLLVGYITCLGGQLITGMAAAMLVVYACFWVHPKGRAHLKFQRELKRNLNEALA